MKQTNKGLELIDYVFETATNDEGLTAKNTALFHLYNPNGIYKQVRESGWAAYEVGGYVIGIQAGEYHYEKLSKLVELKKPRWYNVNYHVNELKQEAVRWSERVLEAKNRVKGGE